jgi:type I restriction enzyme M protein
MQQRAVSKVFANEDFGYRKVTVERPLRLNFAAAPERIARIEDERAFQNLAKSKKRPGPAHDAEVIEGELRQEAIRRLLRSLEEETCGAAIQGREAFVKMLNTAVKAASLRLSATEQKAVLAALGERDPEAVICLDRHGNPEPDTDLRATETVPLREDVAEYVAREVLPHVPDAWVDESKTKVGYEIPLNRHFFVYEPPRPLDQIESDLRKLEHEIIGLLGEVVRS